MKKYIIMGMILTLHCAVIMPMESEKGKLGVQFNKAEEKKSPIGCRKSIDLDGVTHIRIVYNRKHHKRNLSIGAQRNDKRDDNMSQNNAIRRIASCPADLYKQESASDPITSLKEKLKIIKKKWNFD